MSNVRNETVNSFSKEDLLQLVKQNLDQLGIPYEEKAGGFGTDKLLDPAVFDHYSEYTIKIYAPRSPSYHPKHPSNFRYNSLPSAPSGGNALLAS